MFDLLTTDGDARRGQLTLPHGTGDLGKGNWFSAAQAATRSKPSRPTASILREANAIGQVKRFPCS